MSDEAYAGWTAGDHWAAGCACMAAAHRQGEPRWARQVNASLAAAHLAAARMLLDHPPVDILDAYPVERGVEPPKDWRNDRHA